MRRSAGGVLCKLCMMAHAAHGNDIRTAATSFV
jgi:hypothetical protein